MQLFILSLGRSFWVSYCLILGFIFWGFYAHMVASVFISHLREKTVSVCAPEMYFLSAVVAPVKIVGCQGWNSLTKISCQVKMSERIRYLFISSCHSQGMESECLFPGAWHVCSQLWLWALQECRPTDRSVRQFCQCLSLSNKRSLSQASGKNQGWGWSILFGKMTLWE